MTNKAAISSAFVDALQSQLASSGYSGKDERTFTRDIDGDIYGMLTVSIEADRDRECLFYMLFAGVSSKRIQKNLAKAYGEKPKYNMPLVVCRLTPSDGVDELSDIPVCNEAEARKIAKRYAELFKENGVGYIEKHASLAAILQELRTGDSGFWEDRAERRLTILAISAPEKLADEYSDIVAEGRRLDKHLERVTGFYTRLNQLT